MPLFIDQMGREVKINLPLQRIISLVPSQTELLYHLGLGERVVGITKFCVHPGQWKKEKTIIGGTKNFRFEEIDKLKPDLIIGNKEENYKEGIDKLASKYPVWMSDIYDLSDACSMIDSIGEITENSGKAQEIIYDIKKGFSETHKFENQRVAYLIWKNPYMAVGGNTFINNMLSEIGLKNVFENKNRYFELKIDDLIGLNIDYIFLSSEPYPFTLEDSKEFCNLLPQSTVEVVDGEMFSWYGSRLRESPKYFRELYNGTKK